MQIKSASMLVTNNGYCIKLMFLDGSDVCFFTDKDINHRTWKLTEKKPSEILDHREFWRMRREWNLEEISLTETQIVKAIEIAEKVLVDPYHGFSPAWRKKNNIASFEEALRKSTPTVALPKSGQVSTTTKLGSAFADIFQKIKQDLKTA